MTQRNSKSLKQLLLTHELIFILLIMLAGIAGGAGIHAWRQASHESLRINQLIQEIQQTRGDLYRQLKELFDAYFLNDAQAKSEYDGYTRSVEAHFSNLRDMSAGEDERQAIEQLQQSYHEFLHETSDLLQKHSLLPSEELKKTLNTDLENGVFSRYETIASHAENLLQLKQQELQLRLEESQRLAIALLILPILLAALLLLFSRIFLQRAIVRPIADILHATMEIRAGRLAYRAPEAGVEELTTLASGINKMAEDLADSQEALVRSEKQAAQGALVPMLAHNIRNPLASIRATAQVADTPQLDADTREALHDIMDTVDRLERWTGSMLAYLLPLKPRLVSTNLQKLVAGALAPVQGRLKEKSLQITLPPELAACTLETDAHLLEQALYNLFLNAVDASPPGGDITVECEIQPERILLRILDCGPGMPFTPDPNAHTPGPSTKRFGTGLGIPFAFKVCDALNGQLSIDDRTGGGTSVKLSLRRSLLASPRA